METDMVARWLHFASGREALLSANCSHHGATEETMEDVGCFGRQSMSACLRESMVAVLFAWRLQCESC